MDIRDINVTMTSNAVRAVDEICTSLKFFVLQTGTNVRTPLPLLD
jgi:ribosomal protein S10